MEAGGGNEGLGRWRLMVPVGDMYGGDGGGADG